MIDFTKTCATCFRAKRKCLCKSPDSDSNCARASDSASTHEGAREYLTYNDTGSIATRAADIITLDVAGLQTERNAEVTAVCEGTKLDTKVLDAERGFVLVEGLGDMRNHVINGLLRSDEFSDSFPAAVKDMVKQVVENKFDAAIDKIVPNSVKKDASPFYYMLDTLYSDDQPAPTQYIRRLTNEELQALTLNPLAVPSSTTVSQHFDDPRYGASTLQLTQTAEGVTNRGFHRLRQGNRGNGVHAAGVGNPAEAAAHAGRIEITAGSKTRFPLHSRP